MQRNDILQVMDKRAVGVLIEGLFEMSDKKMGTQWVHVSIAVSRTGWMLVDRSFIARISLFGSEDSNE